MPPVLEVRELRKYYPIRRGIARRVWLRAIDGVSFSIEEGETLGLVGESGSGKSTVAKCILRLESPSAGRIILDGQDITALGYDGLRSLRKNMQMVFQDPFGSLNPRLKAQDTVAEPIWLFRADSYRVARMKSVELLGSVGLRPEQAAYYPRRLSGGQQQRVGVARALAPAPRLVILDEPTSSLDVSVQAMLLDLLRQFQRELRLAFLFISHDLAVVAGISARVAVMYLGKIAEIGPTQAVLAKPLHPYTQALVAAVPISHPRYRGRRAFLEGETPSAIDPPAGCRFAGRCPFTMDICKNQEPELREVEPKRYVACHLY